MRQLQQNAAAAIRRVRNGERLVVTDRGRPAAILVPVGAADPLDALDSAGRLTRAEPDLLESIEPLRLPRGAEPPSRHLAALRESER